MTSATVVPAGSTPEDDYGLSAVAQHNVISVEPFSPYEEDAKGLGIYDGYTPAAYGDSPTQVQKPPTPHSNSPSEGPRTRSGRSTRRADSPFSTSKSRSSKSPMPRSKREKKSKLDKPKTPKLTAPLSVLTKDMNVPLKNMDEWVNRSGEMRKQETIKRNGYVTRPMNSFMLYRSAYAERTKQWCLQNNHQVVSSVSGESWPMEPAEVRDRFNNWAKIERANHAAAHPDYKFSPSKANNKKRKGEESEEEEEPSDLDDPDAEYRGGRATKQRKQTPQEPAYLPSTQAFETMPYYGRQPVGYAPSQYHQYATPGRPLPSNIAFDQHGVAYDQQTGSYYQLAVHSTPQYQYPQEMQVPRMPTPQSLGGYGLPGATQADEIFGGSRNSTPLQHYTQYGQQQMHAYQPQAFPQTTHQPQQNQQLYEHQQYLQSQMQPQQAVDPSLQVAFNEAAGRGGNVPAESQFDTALGEMGGDLTGLMYFDQPTSPETTLAPSWSPAEQLR